MLLICLVNCFTSSLATFPPFRVWHFHGLFSLTCIFPIDTCLCATCVLEFDGSTSESPLPLLNACTHSTFSIDASLLISLVMSTCILSIDTCLRATSIHGSDDSSQSPLLNACTHSTFSTLACCFFDIYLPLAFVTCSCVWHAWFSDDFTHDSPLRTCIHFTLLSAFALLVSLHDESSMDSTLFRLVFTGSHAVAGCLSKTEGHFTVSLLLFSMECFSSRL